LAKRLGYDKEAMQLYQEALESDIYDIQGGTAQEGIHVGVMGGTIDLFFRCFGGLEILDDRIAFNPDLPDGWRRSRMRFHVRYKNIWFDVQISGQKVEVLAVPVKEAVLPPPSKIPIQINHKNYQLVPGKVQKIMIQKRKRIQQKAKGRR
jgi:trehalose/maltose hydrolase-like predicted phosphorylase